MGIGDRLKHAWNAFVTEKDRSLETDNFDYGSVSYGSIRPDRVRLKVSNERSIISGIYTRLGIDVSSIPIKHIRLNDEGRYTDDIKSGLNNCLTVEANMDQAASAFRRDIALTLFDKGVAAIVPVDTTLNPEESGGYDILTMRVGEILEWFPTKVRISLYNETLGKRQDITLPKKMVASVENPLYAVMNEPNSTLQRLIRKLNLLDAIDEQSGSGKLDIIIQLPYVIKSETRRAQAEKRRKDIEVQLQGSKYGVAYTDGTEKITQLNRPAENNLLAQIEYLTSMLYGQLGLTKEVFDGTADEATMLNYYNRTIEPVLQAIVEAMARTFLTKTARTQNQSIDYLREPFKLVPVSQLAEIADKFTRNAIATPNEIRPYVGLRPAADPGADKLENKNLPQPTDTAKSDSSPPTDGSSSQQDTPVNSEGNQNGS